MGLERLSKYNFCMRIHNEKGLNYYDLLTDDDVEILNIPEESIYKILQGRKYKIVNLKLEDGKISLKNTSEDSYILKNICFSMPNFLKMDKVFRKNQVRLLEKKIKQIERSILPKYKEKINIYNRMSEIDVNSYIHRLDISVKGGLKYDFYVCIEEDVADITIDVRPKYVDDGSEYTVGCADITNYTTENYAILLENMINSMIKGWY